MLRISHHLLLVSLVVCIYGSNMISLRKPGDQLWSKCEDLNIPPPASVTIRNACLSLTELENCSMGIDVSVEGHALLSQKLDTTITPRACGKFNYTISGLQAQCDLCVVMNDDPKVSNQQCILANTACTLAGNTFNLPTYDAGCFGSQRLTELIQCKTNQCPSTTSAACSGHGSCTSGKCACNADWFGTDCSISSKLFENCRRLDQISGNICVRIIFNQCNIKLQIVLQSGFLEQPIYEQQVPVRQFNTIFQEDMCGNYLGCKVCLKWSNLELTPFSAGGCGTVEATCGGIPVASYSLSCFQDTQVLPTCLGTCLNDCSGHGTCDKGKCYCSFGYDGEDCSIKKSIKCPNDCSGHGTCGEKGCSCTGGYSGEDCSFVASTGTEKGKFNAAYVVVPLVLIFLGVAVGGLVYYFRKRRQGTPKFNQFDLLEQDESDIALRDAQ